MGEAATPGDASLHLPLARFEAQIRLLKQHSDVVPLNELLAADRVRERLSAITFDDAYLGAIRHGVVVCDALNVSACIFVSPQLLGRFTWWDVQSAMNRWAESDRRFFLWTLRGETPFTQSFESTQVALPEDVRIATAQEIRDALARSPRISLGNHTWSHPNLGARSRAESVSELRRSQDWLAHFAPGRLLPVAAYPYGISPSEPEETLRLSGLQHGFRVTGGWIRSEAFGQNHASLPRLNIPAGLSDDGFLCRLRGRFSS